MRVPLTYPDCASKVVKMAFQTDANDQSRSCGTRPLAAIPGIVADIAPWFMMASGTSKLRKLLLHGSCLTNHVLIEAEFVFVRVENLVS